MRTAAKVLAKILGFGVIRPPLFHRQIAQQEIEPARSLPRQIGTYDFSQIDNGTAEFRDETAGSEIKIDFRDGFIWIVERQP